MPYPSGSFPYASPSGAYPAGGTIGAAFESSGLGDSQWQNPSPAGLGTGGGGVSLRVDTFVAADGQVAFVLSQAPANAAAVLFFVNGVSYEQPDDFVVVGVNLTWQNNLFALLAGDAAQAFYGV